LSKRTKAFLKICVLLKKRKRRKERQHQAPFMLPSEGEGES
jgi:hypothetical protein